MCKYCENKHEYITKESKISGGILDLWILQGEPELFIDVLFSAHSTRMCGSFGIPINYCPWCGRELKGE